MKHIVVKNVAFSLAVVMSASVAAIELVPKVTNASEMMPRHQLLLSPQPNQTFARHLGWVYSTSISPNGQTVVSGSYDGTILVWDAINGDVLYTLKAHTDAVSALAISPDGQMLVSGSWDNRIMLWDLASGKRIGTLIGHSDDVKAIAISPDGQTLASGSADRTIALWDMPSGRRRQVISTDHWVESLAFHPDNSVIASGNSSGGIELWHIDGHQLPDGHGSPARLQTFNRHSGPVAAIAFSPDGQSLASGSTDGRLYLWRRSDAPTGGLVPAQTLSGRGRAIQAIAFSPNGETLASSGYDGSVKLWDLSTSQALYAFKAHDKPIWSITFSSVGDMLLTGSSDSTVKQWSVIY